MNKEQAELRELREPTSRPGILFRPQYMREEQLAMYRWVRLNLLNTTLAELAKIANHKTFSSSVEGKHTPRKSWKVPRS